MSTINAPNRHGGKGHCIQYYLEENVSLIPYFTSLQRRQYLLVGKLVGPQSQSAVTAWYSMAVFEGSRALFAVMRVGRSLSEEVEK